MPVLQKSKIYCLQESADLTTEEHGDAVPSQSERRVTTRTTP